MSGNGRLPCSKAVLCRHILHDLQQFFCSVGCTAGEALTCTFPTQSRPCRWCADGVGVLGRENCPLQVGKAADFKTEHQGSEAEIVS
jgi:hypothetical protein